MWFVGRHAGWWRTQPFVVRWYICWPPALEIKFTVGLHVEDIDPEWDSIFG